jgi:hypothetical protein
VSCENPYGVLTPTAPWGDETPGAEGLKPACQGCDRMDNWDIGHTVLRRQQDLLREAENRRLVRVEVEYALTKAVWEWQEATGSS